MIRTMYKLLGILLGLLIVVKIITLIEPEHLVGRSVRRFAKQPEREGVQNVFDEMIMDEAGLLRKSSNICNVYSAEPYHNYLTMEYKHIGGNISSYIAVFFTSPTVLGITAPLNIQFIPHDSAGNELCVISFAYYEGVKKLYIYGRYPINVKEPMPWEELESYKDYLLHDVIIGSYLDDWMSRFSKDNLGEFEVIDCLMPYEYCGMPEREVKRTGEDEQGVSYTTWLETDSMLCVQQTVQHDDRKVWGIYVNPMIMLADEIHGRDTGASRFAVQIDGEDCGLSDLIEINDGFIEWMKHSGQAEGNLLRISPNRKNGCRETKKMLKHFPEEKMKTVLENCEFYIEPGYLHIRFPYWDYEAEEPGFVKNGNDLWRGWLTMRTDDIERFLKVEKW